MQYARIQVISPDCTCSSSRPPPLFPSYKNTVGLVATKKATECGKVVDPETAGIVVVRKFAARY